MKESRYNIWVEDAAARYVYNGLSGAVIEVPREKWASISSFIAGDDRGDADAALLHALVRGRMVIPDDTDEFALLRERYRITRHRTDAFHLTIVTSLGCNFDCPYCFEAKHPSLLDEPVQDRLLQLVDRKLPAIRLLSVTWYGGEPLVGQAALLRLSDEFQARTAAAGVAYRASIITNGYLLTAAVAADLREHGVRSAQVTLDGPPEIHDRRRPLAGGRSTFATVLANVVASADILPLSIRVNLDAENAAEHERLLLLLRDAGLAGRVSVYPGHIAGPDADPRSPSASYHAACLTLPAFADAERAFHATAANLGFGTPDLPEPVGAPCTAVREQELVVGSRGEIYKCLETVGDPHEVIGNLTTWPSPGDRLQKWLAYDPFTDDECRSCVALPVCMGGCAYHALDQRLHDTRCSTFRFSHEQQVRDFVHRSRPTGSSGQIERMS
jgi:uncharacterized protein